MDKEITFDDPLESQGKGTRLGTESQPEEELSSTASVGDGHAGTSDTKPPAIKKTSDGPAATGASTSSFGPGKLFNLPYSHSAILDKTRCNRI